MALRSTVMPDTKDKTQILNGKLKSNGSSNSKSFRWSRTSTFLLSLMLSIIALVIIVWWPLVQDYIRYFNPEYPIWMQIDWLLVGIFLFMSVMITLGADIRNDALLVIVSFVGGFIIESWGTHTGLWSYYTGEKPPLWILPAWPIATLAIERMVRMLAQIASRISQKWVKRLYLPIFLGFILYMLYFVFPTISLPYTMIAILGVIAVVVFPGDRRYVILTFIAGSLLGIFLEYWGTTRECWTYYTLQKPPLFAILAHGLASVAFWRVTKLVEGILLKMLQPVRSFLGTKVTESNTTID